MLTNEQIEQFRRDGYLRGSKVLTDEQIESLRDELARVIKDNGRDDVPQPVKLSNLTGKAETPVWQIVNIWEASPEFRVLIENPTITEEMAQLTGAKTLRLWHDQIQYKPAGQGGVNMWHQDAPYWPVLQPMTEVTAWVALDDVDPENGCMSMVPGSHLWGDQISFLHTLKSFDGMPNEWNGHQFEIRTCPVRAGEVHYHHALTWHGSPANVSTRPRRAVALHYMSEETRFVASGKHLMSDFIEVGDGEVVQGEHFPVVWQK